MPKSPQKYKASRRRAGFTSQMKPAFGRASGYAGAAVAMLFTTPFLIVADAQTTSSKPQSFAVIETTHLRNKLLGKLIVNVDAQLDETGQAFRARVTIWQASRETQRFDIESDTRTYERGRAVFVPLDIDDDGNTDFWVIEEDSKNSIWALYRFDTERMTFLRDRTWVNPKIDPKTRCVIGRTNSGHAGELGSLSVVCRKNDQWIERFARDQTQTRKHVPFTTDCREDYLVKQIDSSIKPPTTTRFVLRCGDEMTKRLPSWVAQMIFRSKWPSRTERE